MSLANPQSGKRIVTIIKAARNFLGTTGEGVETGDWDMILFVWIDGSLFHRNLRMVSRVKVRETKKSQIKQKKIVEWAGSVEWGLVTLLVVELKTLAGNYLPLDK